MASFQVYYSPKNGEPRGECNETLAHLKSAQMILLLISSNYMAADFCYQDELQEAIERDTAK